MILQYYNPRTIAAHPRNVRRDVGDVSELADSMAEHGMLQPIVVAPLYDDTQDYAFVLIAGHRRLAAAVKAGLELVPTVVRDDLDTDEAQIEAMLIENLQRSDLTPVEEAAGYQQLTLAGVDVATIATATGRSESTIRSRLTLTSLPEPLQERIHDRQLTLQQADRIAKLSHDSEVVAEIDRQGATEWAIAQAERDQEARQQLAKDVAEARAAGIVVVDHDDLPDAARMLWHVDGSADKRDTHAEQCPHHALWIRAGRLLEAVCLHPETHSDDTQRAGAPPDDGVDEEQRERAAEFADAVRTAARVRGDWLRAWLRDSKLSTYQLARIVAVAVEAIVTTYVDPRPDRVADWLDVPNKSKDRFDEGPVLAWLAAASVTPTAQKSPAKALVAVLAVEHEQALGYPETWQRPTALAEQRPWFDLLESLGYQLTDFEREHLASAATGAGADDGGGDG